MTAAVTALFSGVRSGSGREGVWPELAVDTGPPDDVVGLHSGGESVDTRDVYGPNDRVVRSEHVGIDAIVEWVQRWTDA